MTKLSVIVPLYNSAQFLPTLFENIRQQSIAPDLEFIFIDDHGSDDSLKLARTLAEDAPFKSVFGATPANGGPGAARNAGLKMAGGEYIGFLDSDDALDPSFCEKLYNAAREADADLAYCHILKINGKKQTIWANPIVETGVFDSEKREYFLSRYKSYFTSFIYRRSFLEANGIDFPVTRSAEDSCFLGKALLTAGRIASVDEPLYHYLYRSDSISVKRDSKRYLQRLASFDALLDFARGKNLYEKYGQMLDYLYVKKAAVGAARNNPLARREIREHCLAAVPRFRTSRYWCADFKLRLAARLLLGM